MDKSLGGSAGVKSTVLTGGPTLKQKEKSVKTEKPPKQSKVNGEQEKSSKGMLIILLLLAIASYFVWVNREYVMQYLAGLSEADSLNTQNDSLNIGLDSIKEEDVALYREMKKSRQDTTLYKSLSDADKAQLNKKKKSYNNKFYYAKDNKKMILIPGQAFKMGSDNGSDIEKPEYSVKVKDFYLDETEVTNAQFKKFLEESKYNPKGSLSHFRDRRFNKDDMPVVDVVYYDAIAYCEWAGKRLPSEREWECAAKDSQNYEYPTGTDMTDKDARFGLNITIGSPVSVKSYRPNKFGIYDLAGNVSEWVHGVISQYPGNITMSRSYGKDRIPRGGSWMSPKEDCKTYRRAILDISKSTGNIGFRCAIGKDEVIELINK
ncbi:MAG: formylglycine-generating enzyme family protein [Candidatus Delongbacteria bacterium]|nr:formylglycine-generating enzyme family protein [Candidatus Delongbacteria bacterium]